MLGCPLLGLLPVILDRRWRAGTLGILLPGSLLRRFLLPSLSRRGRSLQFPFLIVLPHYGVTRLETVVLAVKRGLLCHAGISLP